MLDQVLGQPEATERMTTDMQLFFRMSMLYLAASLMLMVFRFPNFIELATEAVSVAFSYGYLLPHLLKWLLPFGLLMAFLIPPRELKARAAAIVLALAGCLAVQVGCTFLKSTIPTVVPFYADPVLAEFDKYIHGGYDPWLITHSSIGPKAAMSLLPAYLQVWGAVAVGLPVVVAMSDRDARRMQRFSILYLFVWIGLGNVIALACSSAGPVFYDRLLGGDRFHLLTTALQASGVTDSTVGSIQAYLWSAYEAKSLMLGSGISAFPSVHLGVATLAALYLLERSHLLVLPGIAFVAVIQFLSVYTGYHYAIDGYFSIAVVIGLWMWLRRRQDAPGAQENYAAD